MTTLIGIFMTAFFRPLRSTLKQIPGVVWTVRRLRLLLFAHERNIFRLKNDPQSGLLQHSPKTRVNRYPNLFNFVAKELQQKPSPHILSFGCSTGEEVYSLLEYMQDANITGIDINPNNIKKCQKRLAEEPVPNIRFRCAGSAIEEPRHQYDAIFCLAVARHGVLKAKRPDSCEKWLPFSKFEAMLRDLDRVLKPGGMLVVWNSHFRFKDSAIADRFEPVFQSEHPVPALFYGPDNKRIDGCIYQDAIFRKSSEPMD